MTNDPIQQLVTTHGNYKKDILGCLANLVLRGHATAYFDHASFFVCFNIV